MPQHLLKSKPKIAFLGSPDFSAEILEFIISKDLAFVKAIWTNLPKKVGRNKTLQPTNVSKLANKYQIPCFETNKIKENDEISLKEMKIDFAFIVAFGQILPKSFFSIPIYGTYNLHFSLLPLFRGASPMQAAILSNQSYSGITFQQINQKMDTGNILLQKEFSIKTMNFSQVLAKSLKVTKETLPNFFSHFKTLNKTAKKQEDSQATYCYKIKKQDGHLQANDNAQTTLLKQLAYEKWPGFYFTIKEEKYEITSMKMIEIKTIENNSKYIDFIKWKNKHNSTRKTNYFVKMNKNQLIMTVNDSKNVLEISSIKKQGRKNLAIVDFLNGIHWFFPFALNDLS